MHNSHFVVPRNPQSQDPRMSSERVRAMKTSALRALAGRSPPGQSAAPKMTCLCAPTTHPGSFRCRMHRSQQHQGSVHPQPVPAAVAPRPKPFFHQPAKPPPPVQQVSKTCTRCRVRGPSRLHQVSYATDESSSYDDEPEIASVPVPLPVVRSSHSSIANRGISSAQIGARFCALRRLQGSGKDDIMRLIRPTNPRLILLST